METLWFALIWVLFLVAIGVACWAVSKWIKYFIDYSKKDR